MAARASSGHSYSTNAKPLLALAPMYGREDEFEFVVGGGGEGRGTGTLVAYKERGKARNGDRMNDGPNPYHMAHLRAPRDVGIRTLTTWPKGTKAAWRMLSVTFSVRPASGVKSPREVNYHRRRRHNNGPTYMHRAFGIVGRNRFHL